LIENAEKFDQLLQFGRRDWGGSGLDLLDFALAATEHLRHSALGAIGDPAGNTKAATKLATLLFTWHGSARRLTRRC
jgi:hypothetical protein